MTTVLYVSAFIALVFELWWATVGLVVVAGILHMLDYD